LYIIVEACYLRRVPVQDSARVVQSKVLEVDISIGIALFTSIYKLVDELVVFFTAHSAFPLAEIEFVVE
jgi:hypothetical protein